MSAMTIFAPSSRKSCAIALPIPEAPPLTTALLPLNRPILSILLNCSTAGRASPYRMTTDRGLHRRERVAR